MNHTIKKTMIPKSLSEEDLVKINRFTRSELSADRIYTFSVILCDNEMDRDYERFSISALEKLAELFIGKTGIFDHDAKAANQTARIYSARVITDKSITTSAGEAYCSIRADAYMLKNQKNAQLIDEIEAGIKKEVSVGCSVSKAVCSVCGQNLRTGSCEHIKGAVYRKNGQDQICHTVLSEPTDAYEWSFVAVPAQRGAGVSKYYNRQAEMQTISGASCDQILKAMRHTKEAVCLSQAQAKALSSVFDELQIQAQAGTEYRKSLQREIISLNSRISGNLDAALLEGLLCKANFTELKALKKSFEERLCNTDHSVVQLAKQTAEHNHRLFKIQGGKQ